jgi:hypothetical protein
MFIAVLLLNAQKVERNQISINGNCLVIIKLFKLRNKKE